MLNFRDQGGQFLSSASSCIAPQGKPSLGAALGHFCSRNNAVLGRDSHSRQLPAELDEVLLFILTQVSPWSPGGVAGGTDPSPAREEEPWEPRQQIPFFFQARNGVCDGMFLSPVSNSTLGVLPAGIEHRSRDQPWIGIEPPSLAPARWFSLQPLTHLPKIPALTSSQETATGKW